MIIHHKCKSLVTIFLVEELRYNFSSEEPLSELLSERREERKMEPKSAE